MLRSTSSLNGLRGIVLGGLLIVAVAMPTRAQSVDLTLFLVGDGGAAYSVQGTPALAMLQDSLDACPGTCSVLFLGDNLYESGLAPPDHPDRARGERIMNAQIEATRGATGHVVFVPGNHDSGSIGVGGDFERLIEMQRYVEARLGERSFLPADGSPGPVVLDAAPGVAIVFINSQWWFEADHRGERTGHTASPRRTQVLARLDSVLTALSDRHVVLASHHPIRSAGEHAMYWPTRPTLRGMIKRLVGAPQDFDERDYQVFRNDLGRVIARHPDVILAAGHDHVLAYLHDGPGHHIVSGSLSKLDWVSERAGARYASALPGLAAVRFHADGRVQLTFAVIDADRREVQFDEIIARKDISPTRSNIERIDWQIDPRPAPNWGVDAAPTFAPERGPGAEISVRWIDPASPLRESRAALLEGRYDADLQMFGLDAVAWQRQPGWQYFLRGSFFNANSFSLFRGAQQSPVPEVDRNLIYSHASGEFGINRLGYDDLVRIGLRAGVRFDDVIPGLDPGFVREELGNQIALILGGLFEVNTVDSEVLPQGGASLAIRTGAYLPKERRRQVSGSIQARLFRSIGFDRPFTIGLLAAARGYSGNDAFYVRHYLGDGDGLRGYNEWRFSGDRVLNATLEGRATLAYLDGSRRLRPFGILAFADGGLVRTDPRDWADWRHENPIIFFDSAPPAGPRWHARSSGGIGIWANTSTRMVMNATASYGLQGWRLTLAPRFSF